MKKILTIIGARPQFIKASVVSMAIAKTERLKEVIVHTGQHFDANMSEIFFDELGMGEPDYRLDINGGHHGDMTGRMLAGIERVLQQENPDCVLVYGDTNSTLAGALAAAKLHIPVAHVEAGLRSFNMSMPEEVNRILTDRLSNILFCPTKASIENLEKEGFPYTVGNNLLQQVVQVGDVMQDSAEFFSAHSAPPDDFALPDGFVLATIHRAENTDSLHRLSTILAALDIVAETTPVVLPLHPRTKNILTKNGLCPRNITQIPPVGYLQMLWLLQHCGLVVTDSGGVQKEAFFMRKACVTLRDQTEWVELLEAGVNELVGADQENITAAISRNLGRKIDDENALYGGGVAAERVAKGLREFLNA